MRYTGADWLLAGLSLTAVVLILGTTGVMLGQVIFEGAQHLSATFLTESPTALADVVASPRVPI